jgi:Chaperone of endosialidase
LKKGEEINKNLKLKSLNFKTMNLKSNLIVAFCLFSVISFAQNGLISPKGVTFPTYTTGSRPAANTVGVGTVLFNTSDNTHQFSNGSTWLNLLGTTSVPSGTANQTLRNNGTGWVADGFLQNDGTNVKIGTNNSIFSGVLRVIAENDYGIFAKSTNSIGVLGESNYGYGVYGSSVSSAGVYGFSTSNSGVWGSSENEYGVYGFSSNSYGGKFKGRVRVAKGGNGDAGIEFEKSNLTQGGYIGMNGDNEMMIYGFPYGGAIQRWNVNGGSICYATSPTICSDIRLKKDFSNLTNSLASIIRLKGYNYYLRNEKNPNLQTGFIAQEIQKFFPELVQTGSDGYLSVDYTGLIPHLVESVKTLKSENESLKERLSKIENFLKNNESKIETKTSKR